MAKEYVASILFSIELKKYLLKASQSEILKFAATVVKKKMKFQIAH
jgi:hypothetical protein